MGVSVPFNYDRWVARYPEFADVPEAQANEFFAEATVYFRNDGTGPVKVAEQQTVLLNMLTAHIAGRYAIATGQPYAALVQSPLVGRINSASEGSVSIGVDLNAPIDAAWFTTTKYGFDFYQATAPYRMMLYRPSIGRSFGPFFPVTR